MSVLLLSPEKRLAQQQIELLNVKHQRRSAKPFPKWFTASSASQRFSASPAQSWAAYGPINPGAVSGVGTRKKTALFSSSFGTQLSSTPAGVGSSAIAAS